MTFNIRELAYIQRPPRAYLYKVGLYHMKPQNFQHEMQNVMKTSGVVIDLNRKKTIRRYSLQNLYWLNEFVIFPVHQNMLAI